jgi:RNA polymerase sigma-70 factor (ECF subfamily)
MGFNDQTEMGGTRGAFLTTHWTLIEDIKTSPDKNIALVDLLLETYWKPVYCYLRRKGRDNEQAKDLTQDFFHEVVLNRNLVGRADKDKGRFRSFLLYALNQYLINKDRDKRAQKRIPREKLTSLDMTDLPNLPESFSQASAEDSYNYAWLSALLERVISEVRIACNEHGMQIHWLLFKEHVLDPILGASEPASLKELCDKYSIENTKKASNMMMTVKRRFHKILLDHVRKSVASEEQISAELEYLLKFLPKGAQHLE